MNYFSIYNLLCAFVFSTLGYWKLFPKCNLDRRCAFMPFYRTYVLAQCGDVEEFGRMAVLTSILNTAFTVTFYLIDIDKVPGIMDLGILLGVLISSTAYFIYKVRIYLGLCRMFSVKKRWMILWILVPELTTLCWGFSKKKEPLYTYRAYDHNAEAAALSGTHVDPLKNGLSVNLEDRMIKKNLRKIYLLKDIHLNITPGKMVLLLGGSGAGKTTFINALTGYEPAHASILLNGRDVYRYYERLKYEIGMVPQQDLIRYNDTVLRTLQDAATLRLPTNYTIKDRNEKIQKVLDIFGLDSVKHNIVAKQSGGQKKRISIASEFISDPFLFILDEPDSGLDGILARELMTKLHEISRQGKIVIVITHTPDRVIDLFDEVIVLGKDANETGRLVFHGAIDEARTFFNVEKMEEIIRKVNRKAEGGEGLTDELIQKFEEVRHAKVSA